MRLTLEERETVICFNEDSDECWIETCNTYMLSRCAEAKRRFPNDVTLIKSDKFGKRYVMPKKFIRLNPPRVSTMTDEQKKAAADRVRAMNKKGQSGS